MYREDNSTICVVTEAHRAMSVTFPEPFQELSKFMALYLVFNFRTLNFNNGSTVVFWIMTYTVQEMALDLFKFHRTRCVILTQRLVCQNT